MTGIDVLICVECGALFPEEHDGSYSWSIQHCVTCNQPADSCRCGDYSPCVLSICLHGVLWT